MAPDEVDFSQYTDFQDFLDQLLGRPFNRNGTATTESRAQRYQSDPFRPGTTKPPIPLAPVVAVTPKPGYKCPWRKPMPVAGSVFV